MCQNEKISFPRSPILGDKNGHKLINSLSHVVKTLQDPADSAVAAANENLILFYLAKDIEAAQRASIAKVEHLRGR